MTADILQLQQAFDNAELHADTDRLEALLADDFLSIGERGVQLDKRQWIERHADFAYLSLETAGLDVRRYERTAIVRCVQRSRASWHGDEMSLVVRLSQVWIELHGGWRLAGIQFSSLDPAWTWPRHRRATEVGIAQGQLTHPARSDAVRPPLR